MDEELIERFLKNIEDNPDLLEELKERIEKDPIENEEGAAP